MQCQIQWRMLWHHRLIINLRLVEKHAVNRKQADTLNNEVSALFLDGLHHMQDPYIIIETLVIKRHI